MPQREVLRPEDFLQQPPPESLKEPVVEQPEETASQQPQSISSELGVQNQLSQQIAVTPNLAPALQQAMSIQRLPVHLQHNVQHAAPTAPQPASQVAPNPPLKNLNSLMPQILPANQPMPPLPVQRIAAPQQQPQVTPETAPVQPTTAPAAAPPAMAPSAWRDPDPQREASAAPVSPVKTPSEDSRNDWLDDIVIDDEDAAGENKEYAGPKATTVENQAPETAKQIEEPKPSTQTSEQANAMHLMQKTLHEIPDTSKPEPTHAAAPPMQRTMYEIPASAQPAEPRYDQAETPAVVQPAPPAPVESVANAPITAAESSPAQKGGETAVSPTEIALRHQAKISNQAKAQSNSTTALPAVPAVSQQNHLSGAALKYRVQRDDGISLMNGPDAWLFEKGTLPGTHVAGQSVHSDDGLSSFDVHDGDGICQSGSLQPCVLYDRHSSRNQSK